MPRPSRLQLPFDPVVMGGRIDYAMKGSGRKLSELALESQVDKAKLSRAIRGKAPLNLAEVVRICDTTGARVGWIVSGEEPIWSDSAMPLQATLQLSQGGPKVSAKLTKRRA